MATEKKSKQDGTAAKKKPSSTSKARSGGRAHMDPEQSARFLLIGGVGLLIAIALGFIAFGYYWTEIRPDRRTVLKVDDETVSFAAMKRRMSFELFQSTALQQDPTDLATISYENLLQELMLVNRAQSLGVTVDEATFETALRTRIGVSEDADQRAFQDALRRQLDGTGLNESEYRRLVRAQALDTAINDKFKAELPPAILQSKIEVISAPSLEAAQGAIDRINAGEPFADVAKAVSTEPTVAETGGVQDYQAEGGFSAVYDGYAFSAPIGQLSGPLTQGGNALNHYVVRVIDRSEQPIREDQKADLAQDKRDQWLADTKAEMESSGAIVNKFDEDDQTQALIVVYQDATPRLAEQALQQQQQEQAQQTAITQLTQSPATPGPATTPAAESTPAGGATAPAQPPAPAP